MDAEKPVTRGEFNLVLDRLAAIEKENFKLKEENTALSCQLWKLEQKIKNL